MKAFETWPYFLKFAAVNIYGWLSRIRRFKGDHASFRRFLIDSKSWDPRQIEAWQKGELCLLLDDAHHNTAFYRTRTKPVPNSESDLDTRDLLSRVPITEKTFLKKETSSFRNKNYRLALRTSTSGTTGSPMSVEHEWRSIQRRMAVLASHLEEFGVSPFDRSVRLSGRMFFPSGVQQSKPWLYNSAERQLFVSTYHLDDLHRSQIAEKIHRFDPLVIDGYPSAILRLLELMSAAGRTLNNLRVTVSTAETVTPDIRERIETLSGAPLADYYSASEGLPFIQQCKHGTYHVRWQTGILEVLADGLTTEEGDGELICTSFVQRRMPLIRYRTGDTVTGLRKAGLITCACGSTSPTVQSIGGRLEDLVYAPDGRTFGMFTYRALKAVTGLQQFGVVQKDFARFAVSCVYENGVDRRKVDDEIKTNFERVLGYQITLDTEAFHELPLGPGGKTRLVTSEIKGLAGKIRP